MSLSTTSTTVYLLTKYSRCYPSTGLHAASQHPEMQASKEEWQHFTNPVMRVALDVKKCASGELDSYRLRIVWSLTGRRDPDAMDVDADQRDIVFEDLELLAFSRIPSYDTQTSGLPLKAVYRDSIVGIRYLHPRIIAPGITPVETPSADPPKTSLTEPEIQTYRRIQINFESADNANKFIGAIQQVCPCKANAMPTLARAATIRPQAAAPVIAPATSSTMDLRTTGTSRNSFNLSSTMVDSRQSSMFGQHIFNPAQGLRPASPSFPSQPAPSYASRDQSQAPTLSCPAISSSSADSLRHIPVACTAQAISTAPGTIPHPAHPSSDAFSSDLSTLPSSSLHPSTPPSSNPPALAPLRTQEQTLASASAAPSESLLAALRETPVLYDLPHAELEYLVAQIIREDGFVKMLETLDSMWRLKGLLEM